MKKFKIEDNIFLLVFGLIFGIFHFQFVIRLIYFHPLDGIPENFALISYDAPIFFLWQALKISASSWLTNLSFSILGTLMYVGFGALIGSVVDKIIKDVSKLPADKQ